MKINATAYRATSITVTTSSRRRCFQLLEHVIAISKPMLGTGVSAGLVMGQSAVTCFKGL